MSCVSAQGMCADNRSKCADNRLGSGQKTFTKETERDRLTTRGKEREDWRRLRGWERRGCVHTAFRIWVDNVQEVRRQRSRKRLRGTGRQREADNGRADGDWWAESSQQWWEWSTLDLHPLWLDDWISGRRVLSDLDQQAVIWRLHARWCRISRGFHGWWVPIQSTTSTVGHDQPDTCLLHWRSHWDIIKHLWAPSSPHPSYIDQKMTYKSTVLPVRTQKKSCVRNVTNNPRNVTNFYSTRGFELFISQLLLMKMPCASKGPEWIKTPSIWGTLFGLCPYYYYYHYYYYYSYWVLTYWVLKYWALAYLVLTYSVLTYWVLTYWALTHWVFTHWALMYWALTVEY